MLDAARLDPDIRIRSAAIRGLAHMTRLPSDVVIHLRDLWTDADEGLREDVASAFASPSVLAKGGLEALRHLLRTADGADAVTVAGAIVGADVDDAPLRTDAATRLVSAMKAGGGHRLRIRAIVVAPLRPASRSWPQAAMRAIVDVLRDASHDEDLDVRLAALGRLADPRASVPSADRAQAVTALEALSAPDDQASLRGSRARLILAESGDLRVQAWLEGDLKSADPDARLGAAQALGALGRANRAAPLLADEDARVRTRAACTILRATERRR